MYIKKLFVRGNFDEAYIYMQKLVLINEDGDLFFVNLDRATQHLEQEYRNKGYSSSIPTHLFSRNDWLRGEQFKSLLSNVSISKAFLSALKDFPENIELPSNNFIEHVGKTGVSKLLDTTIYNRRIYLGNEQGSYYLDLEWSDRFIKQNKAAEKQHDATCVQINVSHGAVNLSCREDGLFTRFDDFNKLESNQYSNEFRPAPMSNTSFRTGWLNSQLVNYSSQTESMALKVRYSDEKVADADTQEKIAIGFEDNPILLKRDSSNALFTSNTENSLLIQTVNQELLQINVKREDLNPNQKEKILYQFLERIFDIKKLNQSFVIELYDSVQLLNKNKLFSLVDEEILSMKTYPNSRRYKNLTTIVTEEGVYIISIVDVPDFPQQETSSDNYGYSDWDDGDSPDINFF